MMLSKKLAIDFGIPILAAATLWALFGSPGIDLALLASVLWIAWRRDNATGTYLPLAFGFVLICGVLCAVLALIAVLHLGSK